MLEKSIVFDSTNKPIMNIESLLAYGFKEFDVNKHDKHERNWQFCKRDEKGKKFYVLVRLWEHSKWSNPSGLGSDAFPLIFEDAFDATCQFDMNGPKTFDVTINVIDMLPGQVIDWFDQIHNKMCCSYYELYSYDQYDEDGNRVLFNCKNCGKYLPHEEALEPFLCFSCKYENDSGFKPYIRKLKK
jgi:hypothetical protein